MRMPRVSVFFALVLIASTIWILTLLPARTNEPMTGRLPLLAVAVSDNGTEGPGGIAYLDLRIVNGTGNVYIHTDPLTKVDTQASTTFAERYACNIAGVDCSRYDFLYSIESDSPIVGGPSAGAATTALTYAVLTGQHVPSDTAVTGTISSGGIVGNVGGVPQKIAAAERKGLRRVVIPELSNYSSANDTITVERAQTLQDVIAAMGLVPPPISNATISVPDSYRTTMRDVASQLCGAIEIPQVAQDTQSVRTAYSYIENLTANASRAEQAGDYYTQASYCFNMRVQAYYLQLINTTRPLSDVEATGYALDALDSNLSSAKHSFDSFKERLTKPDLNDVQVYSIVEERYRESTRLGSELDKRLVQSSSEPGFRTNFESNTLYDIAYVFARIDSMTTWMRFAGFESGDPVGKTALRQACTKKMSEASEQAEYTAYLTGTNVLDTSSVYEAYDTGDYAACVYQASLDIARAETFLSTIGVTKDELPLLFDAKSQAAYRGIADQTASGHFPVMAYSYYEYAQSLKDSNIETAMLYIENALQLSELDLYLGSNHTHPISVPHHDTLGFAFGVFAMAGLALIITAGSGTFGRRRRKERQKRRSS